MDDTGQIIRICQNLVFIANRIGQSQTSEHRKKTIHKVFLIFLLVPELQSFIYCQTEMLITRTVDSRDLRDRIERLITGVLNESGVPGLAVGVIRKWRDILRKKAEDRSRYDFPRCISDQSYDSSSSGCFGGQRSSGMEHTNTRRQHSS